MKTHRRTLSLFVLGVLLASACSKKNKDFDASGVFEAKEVVISSEANGTLRQFNVEEGQTLKAGAYLGYVDSVQLYLKRKQLLAQTKAVLSKRPQIATQLASLQEQIRTAQREQQRVSNMVKADAATPKQLDDANAQIEVLKKQLEAQQSSLGISSESISLETLPLQVQIEQTNDLLNRCRIVNPITGTILVKYAEENEVTAQGKPLYKIADISTLLLRAYVTETQLTQVKLNQKVKVLVDKNAKEYKELEGTFIWVSDKAEFTPKTIQTKEERANLVYAVKIKVKNDGELKIGMYAEVKFQ